MYTGKLIDQQVTKYKGLSNITDAPQKSIQKNLHMSIVKKNQLIHSTIQ